MKQLALGLLFHVAVPASVGCGLVGYAAWRVVRRAVREVVR